MSNKSYFHEAISSMLTKKVEPAFEFVTITSPAEVKDPEKQAIIRRQARRRRHDKSPQKPEIVINLAEDGFARLSTRRKSSGLSKHDHANNESCVPYQIIGRETGTPLPIHAEMNMRSAQLVKFMNNGADGQYCPLKSLWWRTGLSDQTAFLVMLANLSRVMDHMSSKSRSTPRENPEAITYYTKSILSMQKRIQNPKENLSEGVITSALEFAYYDFIGNNISRWLVHMSGIDNIVQRRGGILTLKRSHEILLLNFWIDVSGSFIVDKVPFFTPPYHLLARVPDIGPSPVLGNWNGFPGLVDVTAFLSSASNLAAYIDKRAMHGIWKDESFVGRTFNGIIHELLSLPRHKQMRFPEQVVREVVRCACLILFSLLREMFFVIPSGISQHKTRVRDLLTKHPFDWGSFLELRLWVLAIAMIAAEEHELSWYSRETSNTLKELRLSGWDEGVEILRSILWMDETFRIRSDKIREVLLNCVDVKIPGNTFLTKAT